MPAIPEGGAIACDEGVARGFIFVKSTPHIPNMSTFTHGPIRIDLSTKRRKVEYDETVNVYDDDVDCDELWRWFYTLGVGSHGRLATEEDLPLPR